MARSTRFQAVIMDMDGVLISSPQTHLVAWRKALAAVQISVTDLEVLLREGGKDEEIAKEIAQLRNTSLTKEQIRHICTLKRQFFEELFEIRPIPGVLDFINDLATDGYRLALVTGTVSKTVDNILQALSLGTKFEVVVTGDMLQFSKPHPEPYTRAIQCLDIGPKDGIVIENAPAGILSAKRAGLMCVALSTSLSDTFLKGADLIFPDVSALREWFLDQATTSSC